jgi:DNA-binding transcriptional LysR family regulator
MVGVAYLTNDKSKGERTLVEKPLTVDTLAVIMHPEHPLAAADTIELARLKQESLICVPHSSQLRRLLVGPP